MPWIVTLIGVLKISPIQLVGMNWWPIGVVRFAITCLSLSDVPPEVSPETVPSNLSVTILALQMI